MDFDGKPLETVTVAAEAAARRRAPLSMESHEGKIQASMERERRAHIRMQVLKSSGLEKRQKRKNHDEAVLRAKQQRKVREEIEKRANRGGSGR